MRLHRGAVLALLALTGTPRADAYQREEHYYSTRLALGRRDGAALAALCNQLADEAPELGAIPVYRSLMKHPLDYASWSLRGTGPDATVGRMVLVQRLLHGLTGGSSEALRRAAADAARELDARSRSETDPVARADAQCALGFALHLYGDSFAHQRLRNSARMYATGIGHFFDATRPDHPLCTPARFELWKSYLASIRTLLPDASAEEWRDLMASAGKCRTKALSGNSYAGAELAAAEQQTLAARGVEARPIPRNLNDAPCQTILDAAARGLSAAPTCAGAWALYRDAALGAFAAEGVDAPGRAYYRGPLFGPGAGK
jgi:hypothetical protein